jgi:MoCo/4Fe-4S cofactor protein with predicted Tat translocation signal
LFYMPPLVPPTTPGRDYWRSLDELADTPRFRQFLKQEFADYSASDMLLQSPDRRRFLKLMGASMLLAGWGLTGCRRWPQRTLAPYAHRPEGRTPGETEHYATIMMLGGIARPLLVTAFDGRPIKIEGNPEHPASLGAADALAQASLLSLYDPDRARQAMEAAGGERAARTSEQFDKFATKHFAALRQTNGKGFAILAEASSSPSVADMRRRLQTTMPQARWYEYEPISWDQQVEGTKLAFGQPLRTQLDLEHAELIVSFDADLLGSHPDAVRHSQAWAAQRRSADDGHMNRLYVIESGHSITGASADERVAVRPSRIGDAVAALATHLVLPGAAVSPPSAEAAAFIEQLAKDLQAHRGHSAIVAGPGQPAEVHALCHAINAHLGNVGKAVTYTAVEDRPTHVQAIAELADALGRDEVETLLILGGNPVFNAPADVDFGNRLGHAKVSIHLSSDDNETSHACTWHLPRAHDLEAWGDGRSWDGSISIRQPLILPLFGGRSVIELLAMVNADATTAGYDIVQRTFAGILPTSNFEKAWRKALHDGIVANSAAASVGSLKLQSGPFAQPHGSAGGLDVLLTADASVYDGRFANNGWLQEMPDPMTKLAWDNAAVIAPATAKQLAVSSGDVLEITVGGRKLRIPAYVLPGVAQETLVISLGYGRSKAGNVGDGVGVNGFTLSTTAAPLVVAGVKATPTGTPYDLVSTQDHHALDTEGLQTRVEQRIGDLVRELELTTLKDDPKAVQHGDHPAVGLQLWDPPHDYASEGHRWAMAVDLNSCTGCNACVIACQSENNIPIVGKNQIAMGRQMHWIRIDRYFKGEPEAPQVAHQPVMCHHCENAPCEQVCPVAATVHDSEGLNVMVYNRCIGTRYCSNNCPYKVRRFNYFDWHTRDARSSINDTMPHLNMPDTRTRDKTDPIESMAFNPEVTVRMRGVMEKCTFCTQRIQSAKQTAKNEFAKGERPSERVLDGEVTPACGQTCPTQAITFGDLNDPDSRVSQLTKNDRAYTMLAELNVRPRLSYLAKVRNSAAPAAGHPAEQKTDH